jgi:hypothetical protein
MAQDLAVEFRGLNASDRFNELVSGALTGQKGAPSMMDVQRAMAAVADEKITDEEKDELEKAGVPSDVINEMMDIRQNSAAQFTKAQNSVDRYISKMYVPGRGYLMSDKDLADYQGQLGNVKTLSERFAEEWENKNTFGGNFLKGLKDTYAGTLTPEQIAVMTNAEYQKRGIDKQIEYVTDEEGQGMYRHINVAEQQQENLKESDKKVTAENKSTGDNSDPDKKEGFDLNMLTALIPEFVKQLIDAYEQTKG